jgi:hypothetical protein
MNAPLKNSDSNSTPQLTHTELSDFEEWEAYLQGDYPVRTKPHPTPTLLHKAAAASPVGSWDALMAGAT